LAESSQPAIERVQVPPSASSSWLYSRFLLPATTLAIEVDGEIHKDKETKEYDLERTRILAENGIRVLRFWNSKVETRQKSPCSHRESLRRMIAEIVTKNPS